ncbi:MAG: SpoIIE family protein phosphatase [Bacteroidota bacterium]
MAEKPHPDKEARALADSLGITLDSLKNFNDLDMDSLVSRAIVMGEYYADSVAAGKLDADVAIAEEGQEDSLIGTERDGPFGTYFLLLFLLTLLSYLAGFIYNRRFKKYFKQKRSGREVPEKLHAFCKKQLFLTPVVNAIILSMPSIIIFIYSVIAITTKASFEGEAERGLFIQLHYLTLVATILEFLFVYYWQKHRVHIKYIEHIYSDTELRKQVFRRKGGKIRNRLMVASGMTTFLPLVIVVVYLILSLTSLKELEIDKLSKEQREILIGPWSKVVNSDNEPLSYEKYEKLFYVNAVDSIVMFAGIGSGIIVSLIYLLLFIKWTNQDITRPVKELLANIRNTRGAETGHYTIVRTNDEIGELAEGYNEMTGKIHEYVASISKMNRELEEKVKERTNEVVMQKEEIEAQKEEIEAQLDLATLQRDTITRQKDQILDSIRYAERIQSAILPPIEYLSDNLTDHFILFKPRDIVSGDYYWTTTQGDKLMVAVADCTGHGVPGAFLSMLGISSMNEIVTRSGSIHANQILEQLRTFVITSLHQTGSRGETQDGIEIALCIIDTRKKVLEFAGAKRPLYIIRKNELMHIRADRMPIGIYDQEPVPFTNHKIQLERGDSIYLFSDGYVDQLGGPSRKTFRSKHFRQLLLDIQDHPMEEQKDILVENLESWSGDVEQIDDILVIGIKI